MTCDIYRITIKGHLDSEWSDWFDGLSITMTSDVWGDLSVTFLFWWAAGATATLSTRAVRVAPREVWEKPPVQKAA